MIILISPEETGENEIDVLHQIFEAGDIVKKGEKVGYITDEFEETISEFKARVSRTILYKIATPPANIDDTLICIRYKE
ncbi:hypothetical protein [Spongiivirga citrea]|uniref:Uncharacterized protein n=1 Tax=Spongiivirga citrea TaxID=1481457 RepID=A0A6M0CII2_9FLAO|nr:hypothetical protein [Spongiivirga citrea]NER17332.1 hypothetical protein [Spongiivirga citrea]